MLLHLLKQFKRNNMNKASIKKYFDILVDLKATTTKTNDFSLNKFCIDHKVSKALAVILQEGGIIKRTGSRVSSRWYWNTIDPTPQMAKEVISRLSKKSTEYKKGLFERKQIHKKREKKVKAIEYTQAVPVAKRQDHQTNNTRKKSWSILFGLFTKYK